MNISELINLYVHSPEWRALRPKSRTTYISALKKWDNNATKMRGILPETLRIRNDLWSSGRPGMASMFVATSSTVVRWARDQGLVINNPLVGIGKPSSKSHLNWPDAAIERFLETAKPTLCLAVSLAIHTAQRIGDIANARKADVREDIWHLTQSKTGEKVRIRLHPSIEVPKNDSEWLVGEYVKPGNLALQIKRHLKKIGYPELTFHGLRRSALSRLAEAGATGPELAAIAGHRTMAMVMHYVNDANKAALVQRGLNRMEERNVL